MGIKFSNLASTTLSSGISNTATTITVADGSLFPTLGSGDFFFATLDSPPDSVEIVKVTARSGNTLTVVRAQEGTAASTHPSGEIIALRVTAGALNAIVDNLTAESIASLLTGGTGIDIASDGTITTDSTIATQSYVTTQINAVIDSAPGALNTLNELAAALGDDANFSTTVTNSIAAKLPLAGGTMSGALNMGSQNITNAGTIGSGAITSTGDITAVAGSNSAILTNVGSLELIRGAANAFIDFKADPAHDYDCRIQQSSDGLILQTGGQGSISTALTLDSSQNASFAGNVTFVDNGKAIFGAGSDLQIYHTGSVSVIEDSGTGNLLIRGTDMRLQNAAGSANFLKAVDGAEVELMHGGATKLATTSTGIDVTGVITTDGMTTSADINFGDNDKAVFGAGSDLQIFHDGFTSIITDQGTGFLALRGDGNVALQNAAGTENKVVASTDGAVSLYHDNLVKLATTSTGITVGSGAGAIKINESFIKARSSDNANDINLIANINVFDADDIVIGSTTGQRFNDNIVFRTNGQQALRLDSSQNSTFAGTISSGAITSTGSSTFGDVFVSNSTPMLVLNDTGNGGGGGAEAKILLRNTDGDAMGIGYTGNQTANSDMIISTNASGTFGAYLGLDAAAIADAQADIILEPKTNVRIATGSLEMGTTAIIDQSRNLSSIANITSTGLFTTTGTQLKVGNGTGEVALTTNDGYGNANLTFNHTAGVPDVNGAALRIETNVDTLGAGVFQFEASSAAVTAGSAVTLTGLASLSTGGFNLASGTYQVSGTTVINASRNLLNIGTISASGLVTADSFLSGLGTAASPAYKVGDSNSGFYDSGANMVGLALDGVLEYDFQPTKLDMKGNQLEHVGNLNVETSSHGQVLFQATDSNSNSAYTGVLIDHNASGSTALTADRSHIALAIDMDSSATGGDTNHEHRLYGIHNIVKATGDSDLIYGVYTIAEAEQTAGTVSSLTAGYFQATGDVTAGTLSNSYGVFAYNSVANASGSTITNNYGGYNKVLLGAGQDSNVNSATGVYSEIEVDVSGASTTLSTGYVYRAEFDNDSAGDVTINTGYLYYGNYAGTLPTTAYGVHIVDAVRNYLNGTIETGDGSLTRVSYGFIGDVNTGMYSSANHQVAFAANGTQRLNVNSSGAQVTGDVTATAALVGASADISGSVAIGNEVVLSESTDRADLLQITSTTSTWGGLQIRNSQNEGRWSFMTDGAVAGIYDDENNEWSIQFNENGATELFCNNTLRLTTTASGVQINGNIDAVTDIYLADQILHTGDTDTYLQFHAANQFRVVTGGDERFEVNQGTATVAGTLNVRAAIDLADNDILRLGSGDDAEFFVNGSHLYLDLNSGIGNFYIRDGTATRYTFNDNGNFTATGNVTAYSDRRVKAQFEPIIDALSKVQQLHGQTYIRTDMDDANRRYAGLIAQDVELVLPEAVSEVDEHLTLDYSGTIALLVEAIKDLKDEVDELKEKLEAA